MRPTHVWHHTACMDFLRIFITLQHTATHCNTLQHALPLRWIFYVYFIIMQHTATLCDTVCVAVRRDSFRWGRIMCLSVRVAVSVAMCDAVCDAVCAAVRRDSFRWHCILWRHTLQHTATPCNTLQHTATRCNTLQYTWTQMTLHHVNEMEQFHLNDSSECTS